MQSATISIYQDDTAYFVDEQIRGLKANVERDFLRMGEKLYEVILFRYYHDLDYGSFVAYCASIDISRSLGYQLAAIHETFTLRGCVPGRLADVGMTKLRYLVPHVENGNIADEEDLDGWLWAAEANSRSDLRQELKDSFGADAVPELPVDYRKWARVWKRLAWKYRKELNHDSTSIR